MSDRVGTLAASGAAARGEATEPHSRLLRCSLSVEESRAYWACVDPDAPRASAREAFLRSWFGAKSEAWTTELLANMRVRFDAFPAALRVLAGWRSMSPDVRRTICHLHVQLTDPLYRAFTGSFLAERRAGLRPEVHRQTVIQWTAEHGLARWAMKTRLQFVTRLLSCAGAAGLLRGQRDPREVVTPRVPDVALEYLLYLLRGLRLDGSLIANPYLASLGLVGGALDDRLRALPSVALRRTADVHELHWRFPDLESWAAHAIEPTATRTFPPPHDAGEVRP